MRLIFFSLVMVNGVALLILSGAQFGASESVRSVPLIAGERGTLVLLEETFPDALESRLAGSAAGSGANSSSGASLPYDPLAQCYLIGPLDQLSEISAVLARIESAGAFARKVSQSLVMAPMYWVYVGPYPSQAAALAELKKLHAQKIDAYLIAKGDLKNAVSLGVYENQDVAEAQIRAHKSLKPRLVERPRQQAVDWLWVGWPGDAPQIETGGDILKYMGVDHVEVRKISCKSIASQ